MNPTVDITRAASALLETLAQPLAPLALAMLPVLGVVLIIALLTWNGRRNLRAANRMHVRAAWEIMEEKRKRRA